jgi:hypothetical protein
MIKGLEGFRFLQIARVGSTSIGVQRGSFAFYGLGTAIAFTVVTATAADLPLPARGLVALYPALVVTILGLTHELGHLAVAVHGDVPVFAVILGWWGPAVLRSSGTSWRADAVSALAGPCTGLVGAYVLWIIGNAQVDPVIALPWRLAGVAGLGFNILQLVPLRLGKLETDGLHLLQALLRK